MSTTSLAPGLVSDDEVTVPWIPTSYDEYLDWYHKDAGRRGEWVDGEVIPCMSTSTRHGRLVWFLIHLVGSYLDTRPIGRLSPPEIELRTREEEAREPDLQVVLNEYAATGVPEYWIVDPRSGREAIDLFLLGAEGDYERVAEDSQVRLSSRVLPGLWLEAAWLTTTTLPPAGKLGTEMALSAG